MISRGSELKGISTHKECKYKEVCLQTRRGEEICSSDVIMHKCLLISFGKTETDIFIRKLITTQP